MSAYSLNHTPRRLIHVHPSSNRHRSPSRPLRIAQPPPSATEVPRLWLQEIAAFQTQHSLADMRIVVGETILLAHSALVLPHIAEWRNATSPGAPYNVLVPNTQRPSDVEDVLHFCYTGRIAFIDVEAVDEPREVVYDIWRLFRIFMLASYLDVESLAGYLEERLVEMTGCVIAREAAFHRTVVMATVYDLLRGKYKEVRHLERLREVVRRTFEWTGEEYELDWKGEDV